MELTSRRVLLGFLGLFLLIEVWTGYWAVLRGPELAGHTRNPRLAAAELKIARGGIYDRNGEPLAKSERVKNEYKRSYLGSPSAAHIVGYMHPRFGKSGLERAYDAELRGDAIKPGNILSSLVTQKTGLDIVTTLDVNIQLAAEKALSGRKGAVVVLDAHTGAILAAASSPAFDPNKMSQELFNDGSAGALFNRALQGRYPPGSSFKPLILAAALESGALDENATYEDTASIMVDGYEINNYNNATHGLINLRQALAYSSNVAFVQIGLATGGKAISELARRIGMFQAPDLRIPTVASHLPNAASMEQERVLAQVSIGQGEAWVTPLHMAMLAAVIGNGGIAVRPYLVQSVGGESTVPVQPRTRVLSERTVEFVRAAMRDVVIYGSGTRASVRGTSVAGKTGSADNPGGKPHAWFIAIAPHQKGTVALAAVIENAGTGGSQAAPVAAQVISAVVKTFGPEPTTPARSR